VEQAFRPAIKHLAMKAFVFQQRGGAFAVKANDYIFCFSDGMEQAFRPAVKPLAMKAFLFQQRGGAGLQACG
jgi:hypothetical protein